jgi:hypothetical protein
VSIHALKTTLLGIAAAMALSSVAAAAGAGVVAINVGGVATHA